MLMKEKIVEIMYPTSPSILVMSDEEDDRDEIELNIFIPIGTMHAAKIAKHMITSNAEIALHTIDGTRYAQIKVPRFFL